MSKRDIQALARRAASGDLAAARRLVDALEAEGGGAEGVPIEEEFERAHETLFSWARGWVFVISEAVADAQEADPGSDWRAVVEAEEPFSDSPKHRASLYFLAQSAFAADALDDTPRGPRMNLLPHIDNVARDVLAQEVLEELRFQPELLERCLEAGFDPRRERDVVVRRSGPSRPGRLGGPGGIR